MKVFNHVVPVIVAGCLWLAGNLLIANPVHSQSSENQGYPSCTNFSASGTDMLNSSCAPPVGGKCSGGWSSSYRTESGCTGNGDKVQDCVDNAATFSNPDYETVSSGYCFAVTSQGQTFCMPSSATSQNKIPVYGPGVAKCYTL